MKLVRTKSLLGRILHAIPIWMAPYNLYAVRVGKDITSMVEVVWKFNR